MKTVLIVSPSFPPVNAADMHRVRQSISYFKEFGWIPIILTVKPQLTEYTQDYLLLKTIPDDIEIVHVNAFSTKWTRKIGLGSLALRAIWFLSKEGNKILQERHIDLIYFSTTMFPVLVLGSYWKKKFNVPYVIDMQDPWHSDDYLKLPVHKRPPKFWFSYRLNKYLEPIAMKEVIGIVSVSQGYCESLQKRYSNIKPDNCTVIPFSAFQKDLDVLEKVKVNNRFFSPSDGKIHVVYVGVCYNMNTSINLFLRALKLGLSKNKDLFEKIRIHFIGTSYAPEGKAEESVAPLAAKQGLEKYVQECTSRVPYFEALQLLKDANMLIMLGTDDRNYTASKLFSNILANKPLLAVFNHNSSVVQILKETRAGAVVEFIEDSDVNVLTEELYCKWLKMLQAIPYVPETDWTAFEPYTAREMARKQAHFFNYLLDKV